MENYIWAIWFITGLILMTLEIFTPGFVLGLFGVACLFAGAISIFTNNLIIQIIVFIIVLIFLMIYIRPIFLKYFIKKDARKSNVDALIGKTCIVDTEIDNLNERGYIKIGADYWKAKSNDGSIIPKGTLVNIEKMEGITVTVSLKKEN